MGSRREALPAGKKPKDVPTVNDTPTAAMPGSPPNNHKTVASTRNCRSKGPGEAPTAIRRPIMRPQRPTAQGLHVTCREQRIS